MEESVVSYAVLTFLVFFGIIKLFLSGLKEQESRNNRDDRY